MPQSRKFPHTPDGRYFVSKNKLWRCTNPNLSVELRDLWVKRLMAARRGIHLDRENPEIVASHKQDVHRAKVALGERGEVWWSDGKPDELGQAPAKSSYARWWSEVSEAERARGFE